MSNQRITHLFVNNSSVSHSIDHTAGRIHEDNWRCRRLHTYTMYFAICFDKMKFCHWLSCPRSLAASRTDPQLIQMHLTM